MKTSLPFCALLSASASAHAICKCETGGSVTVQDAPCSAGKGAELRVSPASGRSTSEAPTSAPSVSAPPSGENASVTSLRRVQHERRAQEIDDEIAHAQRRIDAARATLDDDMTRLRTEQGYANNNLAGATYQQAKSTEMQAASDRFRSVLEYEQANIKALQDEKRALSGK